MNSGNRGDYKVRLMRLDGMFSTFILSFLGVSSAAGSAFDRENADWHAFVSQGLVYTTDNNYFGDSDGVSFRFHDISVGGSWNPASRWRFSGQLKYRQAGEQSRDNLYVDYALVDFRIYQSFSTQMGIRAGRTKNRFGFFRDIRDLPFSSSPALLLNSVYPSKFDDVTLAADALSLYLHREVGSNWLFSYDLVVGKPVVSDQAESEVFASPLSGSMEDEQGAFSRALFERQDGSARVAVSYAKADWNYDPDPGTTTLSLLPGLSVEVPLYGYEGEADLEAYILSLELNFGNWQFITERIESRLQIKGFVQPSFEDSETSRGYYFSLSRQLTPSFTVYARRGVTYTDKNDRSGKRSVSNSGIPDFFNFSRENVVGMKYQFNDHWSLAAEYLSLHGTDWLARSENDLQDLSRKWDMFIGQITYRF